MWSLPLWSLPFRWRRRKRWCHSSLVRRRGKRRVLSWIRTDIQAEPADNRTTQKEFKNRKGHKADNNYNQQHEDKLKDWMSWGSVTKSPVQFCFEFVDFHLSVPPEKNQNQQECEEKQLVNKTEGHFFFLEVQRKKIFGNNTHHKSQKGNRFLLH